MKDASVLLGLLYFAQALSPEASSTKNEQQDKAVDRIDAAISEAIKAVRQYQSLTRRPA